MGALVRNRNDAFQGTLRAARAGDESALAELYRRLHPRVLRFLLARAPPDAEDFAHELWIGVASGLERFRGDEPAFRAWVFTIARRRLADAARRASRRPTVPVSTERLDALGEVGDVEQEAIRALETREALARISALPPAQAEVLLLRVLGGLDVDQVASVMRKRVGTIRVLQHRALAKLAEQREQTEATDGRAVASLESRDRR